jgi:hypothetical protein
MKIKQKYTVTENKTQRLCLFHAAAWGCYFLLKTI